MSCVRIQTDATERIVALALDGSLGPVTGVTDLLVSIWRTSDGYFYDFNDDTFKNSGWTDRQIAMAQLSAINAPGEYYYDFDTSAIQTPKAADDTYMVRVDQSPGTSVANLPQTGEIKEGQWPDRLDADISSRSDFDEATDEVDIGAVKGTGVTDVGDFKADVSGLSTFNPATDEVDVGAVKGVGVTNVDDFKADVSALALEANVQAHAAAALASHPVSTRTQDIADRDAIIVEVDENETKIDAVQSDVTAVKGKTDQLAFTTGDVHATLNGEEVDVGAVKGVGVAGVDDFKADVSGLSTFNPATEEVDVGAVKGVGVTDVDDFKADTSALALEANVEGHAADALDAYDPPKRAEATADKDEIITKVDGVETKVDALPDADVIADAVWDEDIADHLGAGSTGKALNDAGASIDPSVIADAVWDEELADHTTPDTTGEAINRLNMDVVSGTPFDPDGSLP